LGIIGVGNSDNEFSVQLHDRDSKASVHLIKNSIGCNGCECRRKEQTRSGWIAVVGSLRLILGLALLGLVLALLRLVLALLRLVLALLRLVLTLLGLILALLRLVLALLRLVLVLSSGCIVRLASPECGALSATGVGENTTLSN
jgi:hypothetical protein